MKGISLLGVALVLLGIIGLVYPAFTTTQNKEVAKLGDFKLQAKEEQTHFIPPIASGAVLALGVVLVGAGLYRAP